MRRLVNSFWMSRLPELPSEWERVTHDQDSLFLLFRHNDTGDVKSGYNDLRCTLDALKRRGVHFEEFVIV